MFHRSRVATTLLTLALAAPLACAQAAPSKQDTQFLNDLAQDSNFEIKSSQLALQKSASADVKAYATMLIHDHTLLKAKISSADRLTKTPAVPPTSMTSDDQTMYSSLQALRGEAFDQAYIKQLVKGNDQIQKEEKSEADGSSIAQVKALAAQSVSIDAKHEQKAKELAKAHNIQS